MESPDISNPSKSKPRFLQMANSIIVRLMSFSVILAVTFYAFSTGFSYYALHPPLMAFGVRSHCNKHNIYQMSKHPHLSDTHPNDRSNTMPDPGKSLAGKHVVYESSTFALESTNSCRFVFDNWNSMHHSLQNQFGSVSFHQLACIYWSNGFGFNYNNNGFWYFVLLDGFW